MHCFKCGTVNENGSEICQRCGAALTSDLETETTILLSPVEVDEEYGDIELTPEDGPLLIVKKGPSLGEKFNLVKDEVVLGRDPDSDIFLDDVTVSRHHAKILVAGDMVSIVDVGSLNGTYINQERIEEPRVLKSNDELQIGKFKLIFLFKDTE